jgi:hypothetical protein
MSRQPFLFSIVLSALFLFSGFSSVDASRRPANFKSDIASRLLVSHANTNGQRTSDIVDMQKTIYSVLGQQEVSEIVSRFRPEFKRLDVDGSLANTLDALYEMRLLDLQIAIQHAKKMRNVLDLLGR